MSEEKQNLPTIAELTGDVELALKNDQLNLLLNQAPPQNWIKTHPYIKGHNYLPIDKVELMLKRIFKRYRIEITGQGIAFNGVWVTVRLHYQNPIDGAWDYHDGIGAMQLQTKAGTSPADLININNGAVSMAFPIAKTLAIKDAADMFGKLFGADLNRKDTLNYTTDKALNKDEMREELKALYELKKEMLPPDEKTHFERIISCKETKSYKKAINNLAKL